MCTCYEEVDIAVRGVWRECGLTLSTDTRTDMSSTHWISAGVRSSEETHRTVVSILVTLLALSAAALSKTLHLPPVIVEHPPTTLHYRPGSLVTLPCKADASPPPTYEWYEDGELLPSSEQTASQGHLLLQTPVGQPASQYQCVARNEAGVAMSPISTLVPAELVRVSPAERWLVRDYTVVEGFPLHLPCNHTRSEPPQSTAWFTVPCSKGCHDQTHVVMDQSHAVDQSGDLVLLHAAREDALIYKCVAYNHILRSSFGGSYSRVTIQPNSNSLSRSPSLFYMSQLPARPVPGDDVVMTCMFDGQPDISWRRRGGGTDKMRVGDFGRELRVDDVRQEDSGMYECEARNSRGVSTAVLNLTVHEAPRPVSNASLVIVRVEEGTPGTVRCGVESLAPLSYLWYYNARPLDESGLSWRVDDDLVFLDNLTLSDTGLITCNASNPYGAVLISYYLLVQETVLTTRAEVDPTTPQPSTTPLPTEGPPTDPPVTTTTDTVTTEPVTTDAATTDAVTTATTITTTKKGDKYVIENTSNKSGMSGKGVGDVWWSLVLKVGAPLGVLLLLGSAVLFIFVYICKSTSSYSVGDRERHYGCNDDYDSDDSGYDEKDEKRARKKLKKKEERIIEAECQL